MKFTVEQERAANIRNADVLVSAGAGSGKTAVLVERILRMITGKNPVNIDALVVVTFTDAAAAEMKSRIGKELSKRVKQNPADANLRRQLTLLGKANISTIHSFCLRLARRFFHKIDMDPGFRVADTAEIELMKAELLEELFEEYYQNYYEHGVNEEFVNLADVFDMRASDENFRRVVLELYEFSRSCPNPQEWLDSAVADCRLDGGIEGSRWYDFFVEHVSYTLSNIRQDLLEAADLANNPNLHDSYRAVIQSDLEQAEELQNAITAGFEGFVNALDFDIARLSGAKSKTADGTMEKADIDALKAAVKVPREDFKARVKAWRGMCNKPPHELVADMTANGEKFAVLADLAMEFSRRFQAAKREKNVADFADFEHFCLQILFEADGELSAEALALQSEFEEIFIDEYQDVSLIQEAILAAIARGGAVRRLMVGDVKQCIYQFRNARPDIFVDKLNKYAERPMDVEVVLLAENFRSRRMVVDAINCVFSALMSERIGGVTYDDNAKLRFAADYNDDEQTATDSQYRAVLDVIVADGDGNDDSESSDDSEADLALQELTAAEVEAQAVAEHISKLMASKTKVRDREVADGKQEQEQGQERNLRFSDIVILLRSKAAFQIYVEALRNRGIPAFSETAADYFLASEVMIILALLQIIDNPRQDIPLITALHSDIFMFSPDELVEIGRFRAADADYYSGLRAFADSSESVDSGLLRRVNDFLEMLESWREKAAHLTISQLINVVYTDTGFYDYVGVLPGGKLRRANLMLLFERAAAYEKTSYKGLFNFIRYIEKLQKNNYGFEKANIVSENDDVVRIMTIHKSKGLEFPVVFVCGLGTKFNLRDASRNFVLNYDLGMAMKAVDLEKSVISNTVSRSVIGWKITQGQIAEEMRILYVALTRAKERLYLIGYTKNSDRVDYDADAVDTGAVRPYDVMRGRSYLDWLLLIQNKLRNSDCIDFSISAESDFRQRHQHRHEAVSHLGSVIDGIARDVDHSGKKEQVLRRLEYAYPHRIEHYAPAKMSVTEVKRLYYREFLADSEDFAPRASVKDFRPPKFLQPDAGTAVNAATRGIIVHTVLESLDFNTTGADDVLQLVTRLVACGLLIQADAEAVPVQSIVKFLQSDVAARIRRSEKVRREVPFAVAVPPGLINSALSDSSGEVVLHGVVDCCFDEGDGFVIVDYKTERVDGDVRAAAEAYRPQLELYSYALEKIFERPVIQRVVYFFSVDAEVVV